MTLLLTRGDVAGLLDMAACIDAVERAFAAHARGESPPPAILGVHAKDGGFHVKAALAAGAPYFAAKLNANFMGNADRFGLPTIQGVVVLSDANDGRVLAVMDSIEITIVRTAAGSAVAAKYCARADARTVALAGCGNQGRSHLRALAAVRPIARVRVFDRESSRAVAFAKEMARELGVEVSVARDFAAAARESDMVVTCTPSREPVLAVGDVAAGAFVAAVGADNPEKWEIAPALMAASTVVTDITEQCASIGDLHHAIAAGAMKASDVYAELGEIAAGRKAGRRREDETVIFDSTGTALQDVAAAVLVYERARAGGVGQEIEFGV